MGFLEDWYNNGYFPSEQIRIQDERYSHAIAEQQKHSRQIIKSLGADGEKIFEEYLSATARVDAFELASTFTAGFRLALRIILETK